MSEEEFKEMVAGLKRGDNTALALLQPFQRNCTRMLIMKSGASCDEQQAYDIFVDSVLDFRKNVLQDRVNYQNIPAYLQRICWYKWLETIRAKQRHDRHRDMISSQLYPESAGLSSTEVEEDFTARLGQLQEGMQQLSAQCRKVLTMAIADDLSMAEIAAQLGMASADVAKTTKSRCYKRLVEWIRNQEKE